MSAAGELRTNQKPKGGFPLALALMPQFLHTVIVLWAHGFEKPPVTFNAIQKLKHGGFAKEGAGQQATPTLMLHKGGWAVCQPASCSMVLVKSRTWAAESRKCMHMLFVTAFGRTEPQRMLVSCFLSLAVFLGPSHKTAGPR